MRKKTESVKAPKWRPRVYTEELCPQCGMFTGVRCRTAKGAHKEPCMLRVLPAKVGGRDLVQRELFGGVGNMATDERR